MKAICSDIELLSRADERGASAVSYFLDNIPGKLFTPVTGLKSFLSGSDRMQKKGQFEELRKFDIYKHNFAKIDVALTQTQANRIKWTISFIADLYQKAKSSNQRMIWPKKDLAEEESDMQDESKTATNMDEIDCLVAEEFKKVNGDFFSMFLKHSIFELHRSKLPTMEEFAKGSNTSDVKLFIDSCKNQDKILADMILQCCRVLIEDFEFDIEGSTKIIKSVDRYANMKIQTVNFQSPIEVVLDFLLRRQNNLPQLSKNRAQLPTEDECRKFFEKTEQGSYYNSIEFGFSRENYDEYLEYRKFVEDLRAKFLVDILQIFSGASKINDPKNWKQHCKSSKRTIDIMQSVIFKNSVKILNISSQIDEAVLLDQVKKTIQSNQQIAKTFIQMNQIGLAEARATVMGSMESNLLMFITKGCLFAENLVKREDLASPVANPGQSNNSFNQQQ